MRPTEPFRQEHEQLHAHVEHLAEAARDLAHVGPSEREARVTHVLEFLRGTLIPHAQAEEQVLYPAWAKLVGFERAAVPMVHDHEAIVERIERLGQANVHDVDALQELLYGLYALIEVHFRKEEDLQLPDFDAAPPEATKAALERMQALAGGANGHSH